MLVTARAAARRLHRDHEMGRGHAQAVLRSGLVGKGVPRGVSMLYESDLIDDLAARPEVPVSRLDDVLPFIGRLGRGREFDLTRPWREQAAVVSPHWYVPLLTRTWMLLNSPLGPNRYPLVATLAHFVVFGGEIVGRSFETGPVPDLPNRRERCLEWVLEPPGNWFGGFTDRRITLPGGPAALVWGAPVSGRFPTLNDTISAPPGYRLDDLLH